MEVRGLGNSNLPRYRHFAGSSCRISMNFLSFVRVPEQLNHRNWEYSKKHVFHYFSLASSNHHVLICSATWSWDLFKANGQWDTNFCQVHQLAATLPLEMISCTGNKKNQNRHGNLNQSFHVKVSYFDAHTFEFDWIWVVYVHELIRLKECLDWFDQNYSIFQSELSRWWFQILLIFTPSLGKCSNLTIWCVLKTNDNL